uniref:Uncharacterized protein n=1 Tax=Oryza sativa subsp. japonica TaxID=39947 RepID=Q7XF99_ORYSJ|nr:hypothetical protein LOC_Os10g22200 [Oryza sativa Japonica Group]
MAHARWVGTGPCEAASRGRPTPVEQLLDGHPYLGIHGIEEAGGVSELAVLGGDDGEADAVYRQQRGGLRPGEESQREASHRPWRSGTVVAVGMWGGGRRTAAVPRWRWRGDILCKFLRDMFGQKPAAKTYGILEFVRDKCRIRQGHILYLRIKSTGTLTNLKTRFWTCTEVKQIFQASAT